MTNNTETNILLGSTDRPPYDENASAEILSSFNAAVLGQLLAVNSSFELQPSVIRDWKWDFARSIYVLTLRDDLVFHNGRKATALDLEFSLLRGFFTEKRSFYRIFLGNIDGLDSVGPSTKFKSGVVTGIKVTGNLTLEVKLKAPNPGFLFSLVNPYFSLVPQEEMNADFVSWKRFPIGTGPYKVAQGFNDGRTVLERLKPEASRIQRAIFHTRVRPEQVYDISLVKSDTLNGLAKTFSKYPVTIAVLHFSNIHPLGQNESFRKAVQTAIDRTELLEGIPECKPSYEFLPKHFWGRLSLKDPLSLTESKKHLQNVDPKLLNETWDIPVFTGNVMPESLRIRVARITSQLAKVGIKVRFYPSNEKFISKATALKSPISMSGRVVDFVDPLIVFAALNKNSPYEFDRPMDLKQFQTLFDKASHSVNTSDRLTTIQALSAFINDKAIVVPLYEVHLYQGFNQNRIESLGEQNQPMTLFIDRITVK